jgi:hypothetical protein
MKTRLVLALACALSVSLLTACAGTPVALGARSDVPVPQGLARTITARGCGFQLLLLIPVAINNRLERAYQDLMEEAGGDYVTDIEVKERWAYGFVGTSYCTILEAKAIKASP